MINEKITLYNGVKVPVLGLGTWMIDDDKVKEVVLNAFKLGYRHIDTAEAYGNERGVGEAIRESGLKREEIFLTTKLIAEAKTYEEAKGQIDLSFKKLGVDYIDLMIIHSPQPWADFRNGNHYYEGNLAAWKALCEFYEAGKIRAIGVSNFEKEDIERELGDVQEVSQYVQELEATRKYLENIVRRMIRLREQASGRRYSEIIEKARDYIGQNYMSENISLNLVASSVNISPSYFSSLFSQEVGSTFVEYLTGVRMEKAKELLMCSDKRTSDIGYEVGYKDSHYFSYIFKKTQGCSPKEFRSRGRG